MKIYSSYRYKNSGKEPLVRKVKVITAIAGFILLISFAIVLFASINKNETPQIDVSPVIGILDAIAAFAIIGLSIYIYILVDKVAKQKTFVISYRLIRMLFQVTGVFIGLVFFILWIERSKIDFNILLPGLAWRFFILISSLPLLFFNKTIE